MTTGDPNSAGDRSHNGPGVLLLAALSAALALHACGGEVAGSSTGNVMGGTGGYVEVVSTGGRPDASSGGAFTLGGASESGGVEVGGTRGTGGAPTGDTATGGTITGGTATGGIATGGIPIAGGTATGGIATGGVATGGTAPALLCDTVTSLPIMGTVCNTAGESRCDASGNQCVCERGIWYCDTNCASTYPTPPTASSACTRGTACSYPSGVSCSCINLQWHCMGASGCPAAANVPITGDPCNGLTDLWCDYPNWNANFHMTCVCTANAGTGSSWTCVQSYACPATQPVYSLANTCLGFAFCSYGSVPCTCLQSNTPWVCGLGPFIGYFGE